MLFERWKSPWDRTWAYVVFKKHHTQLNDLRWSHHCASRRASSIAKSVGGKNPASKAFPAAVSDKGRSNMPLDEWYVHYSDFDNWMRLSNSMALCSYFEIYIAKVVNLALRSDPAILLNSSKAVDGAVLLKNGSLPDFKDQVTSITKGTWSARISAYKKYFGTAPQALIDSESELDRLRILRNGVGHAFGRELNDYESPLVFEAKKLQRISDNRLEKWLGVVEKVVHAMDEHLREKHIGSFEVIEAYHAWDKKFHMGHTTEHATFKKLFPIRSGLTRQKKYFEDAIKYYKNS